MDSDGELLTRFTRDRDERAFAEIVRRHADVVYSVALRTLSGDAHTAEDVAQSVFVKLARHRATLHRNGTLVGWLYTTAHHAACNEVRSEVRRRRWEKEAHAMHETLAATDASTEWHRLRPLLDDAMHELRADDREVLLLRFFENRPYLDIGRETGLAENTARMRVERALEKLRVLFAKRGIDSTSTALSALLAAHSSCAAPAGFAASATAAALAAVGTTSGASAVSLLNVMNSTKITVSVSLLAVATLVVGVRQTLELRRAENANTATTAELAHAQERIRALDVELRQSKDQATTAAVPSPQIGDGMVDVRAYEQEKARRLAAEAKARAEIQEKVALSPEIQKLRFEAFRASAALRYGALHKSLGLSPDQVDRLSKLMDERFWVVSDLTASARTQNIARSDSAFQAMKESTLEPVDAKFRALLGDEGLKRLREFENTGESRDLVEGIYGRLAFAATPLSTDQALQLAAVFAQNRLNPSGGNPTWLENQVMGRSVPAAMGLGDIHWDNLLAQAGSLLAPDQLKALNIAYLHQAMARRADRTLERRSREASEAGK